MRRLIACRTCNRQYDVSDSEIGSYVHCHCGDRLTVTASQADDAAVVRCSACGGAREAGAAACTFCGADFTLHELDMQTMCPYCMARISNHAKFCHRCGVAIEAEPAVGETSEHNCPACGAARELRHRALGASRINALECPHCAGLWLTNEAFRFLAERARDDALEDFGLPPQSANRAKLGMGGQGQEGPMYRPCVQCRRLMTRTNYARTSGVIIDTCKNHGVWFDAHELMAALDWIRSGGLNRHAPNVPRSVPVDPLAAARAIDQAKAIPAKKAPAAPASPLLATYDNAYHARYGLIGFAIRLLKRLVTLLLDVFT